MQEPAPEPFLDLIFLLYLLHIAMSGAGSCISA